MEKIEKEFYKTFKIKPIFSVACLGCLTSEDISTACFNCSLDGTYLEITPETLFKIEEVILSTSLSLQLILNEDTTFEYVVFQDTEVGFCEKASRKEALLQLAINIQKGCTSFGQEISYKKDIKSKIQEIFEVK